jgi:hypothetical protein
MKNYIYQNTLISKKQLKQLLAWSFTKYDSMQACLLADELKYLGFKYASKAGISISIEDLKVPFNKNLLLQIANQEIKSADKIHAKGKLTDVERFQKIIDTWNLTSESLKDEVVSYFKNYDPLNSVYIMAFSGARGNLSQVRQLVGMRGLMSDPSGEILQLPIKKNFREGLTITDYLMSGYGARKGIIDTALKTANSGYLTRRLIDVAQDIIIREKDCLTTHSCLVENKLQTNNSIYEKILGRLVNKPIYDSQTNELIADINTQITPNLIKTLKQRQIKSFYIRSPLTCSLYRSICQKCYGWDLATENIIDVGEAIGIIAGQSIGEPGTQLTMRTFHTGGIFTSEIKGKIRSPMSGLLKFSKRLKRLPVRTTRGEDVLLTKNAGSLLIIPESKTQEPVKLELFRNTIIFYKNNQYVQKNAILAELVDDEKQTRTQVKPVLSTTSGEVFIPRLTNKLNLINQTKLLWILSGQVYQAPVHSFLNLSNDYKINKNSYVFRTKIVNDLPGLTETVNTETDLFQRRLELLLKTCWSLKNSTLEKLSKNIRSNNFILTIKDAKYFVNLKLKNARLTLPTLLHKNSGTLVTNKYKTITGGYGYYDFRIKSHTLNKGSKLSYFLPFEPKDTETLSRLVKLENHYSLNQNPYCSFDLMSNPNRENLTNIDLESIANEKNSSSTKAETVLVNAKLKRFTHRSIIWVTEEVHEVNCDPSIALVEHENFISKNFEIIPGIFSKTEGIVQLFERNNVIQEITIQSGSIYKGKQFHQLKNKVFYPGEIIFDSIKILQPSLCESIGSKGDEQLLIRPLTIYEIPRSKSEKQNFETTSSLAFPFKLENKVYYNYQSNQRIKHSESLDLATTMLSLKTSTCGRTETKIQLVADPKKTSIDFFVNKETNLNHFIAPSLRYKNIQSCLLVQSNQFIDTYTTLGYLEAVLPSAKEIVQFKSKCDEHKEICLISNEDCITVEKNAIQNKTIDNLLINDIDVNYTGKILMDNGNMVTIQKGRPYFFPNCKNDTAVTKTDFKYTPLCISNQKSPLSTQREISLNYYDITKELKTRRVRSNEKLYKFSKMFIKKNGKLYSSVLAGVMNRLSLKKNDQTSSTLPTYNGSFKTLKKEWKRKYKKITGLKTLVFTKSSNLQQNPLKSKTQQPSSLILATFFTSKFYKFTGGIHAITDDYFDQEVNSVFCKNGEFVENGQTLGLLNFEKEITGDIVQGLPRVEQLLEARKKKQASKNISINQKKNLLTQTTSIDSYFEFRKLGTTIKENEKINPHNLLKVYFNYYGLIKHLFCEKSGTQDSYRLSDNYEASYRSFKKVQSLILNSVQSVYKSQGVGIADKHLEVIIKQMTTKVLITHQGSTPLLPREVIDLYHIRYINNVAERHNKQKALYVPVLLGITKAALNNPSFISAASFQETTRVLTKAAIEGRVDWLRGLKENIIIGHLMPAGTGSPVYTNYFKKPAMTSLEPQLKLEQVENT